MHKLIRIELFKIFRRGRTYIGFGAILLIVTAIEVAVSIEGKAILDFAIQHLEDSFMMQGNLINVNLVMHIILNSLIIQIPFLIALVTGDLLAGESNAGTFRLLLTRPVSRTRLVFAKFLAGWIYTVALMVFMFLLSLGLGYILLGTGDLIVLTDSINIFTEGDIMWRFLSAYGFGILVMTAVAALSFMFSAFATNSIGPIIGTIAVIIGLTIISTVGATIMKPVNPFLFTTHLNSWQLFFDYELDMPKIVKALSVVFGSSILFFSIALYHFTRKDILS